MFSTNEKSLKSVIEALLDAYNLTEKIQEVDIIQSWKKIMGKMIANHTTNLYISNKILFVTIDSSALKQELLYAREKIIKMICDEYKKEVIKEIVFK